MGSLIFADHVPFEMSGHSRFASQNDILGNHNLSSGLGNPVRHMGTRVGGADARKISGERHQSFAGTLAYSGAGQQEHNRRRFCMP